MVLWCMSWGCACNRCVEGAVPFAVVHARSVAGEISWASRRRVVFKTGFEARLLAAPSNPMLHDISERNDVEPRTPLPPTQQHSRLATTPRSPQLLVPGMLKATFSTKSNRLCSVQLSFDPTVPARQLARAAMLQGRATPGMAGMMAGMLGMGGVDVSSLVTPKGATPNPTRR